MNTIECDLCCVTVVAKGIWFDAYVVLYFLREMDDCMYTLAVLNTLA